MAAPKTKTRAERETRLSQISALFCQGMWQSQIAVEMGVSDAQITYDMKILMARWREASTAKIEDWKATELEKVNHLEATYWQAWIDSCETGVNVAKEKTTKEDGVQTVTSRKEVAKPTGDPRHLAGVQWCIEKRCKLLGLYPEKGTGEAQNNVLVLGGADVDAAIELELANMARRRQAGIAGEIEGTCREIGEPAGARIPGERGEGDVLDG